MHQEVERDAPGGGEGGEEVRRWWRGREEYCHNNMHTSYICVHHSLGWAITLQNYNKIAL